MAITLSNVGKRYGQHQALRGVDLTLNVGQPVTLLGKNGAGKSTLLKIIAGLTAPTDGTLDTPPQFRVAYLPEDRGLYGQLDVTTHLRYFAELAEIDPAPAVSSWLQRLQIEHLAKAKVKDLSKGNQQKIQLASCLIDEPECALLDEPFSGLDPINLILLREVIRDYARDHYVMLSAHHVDQIAGLSDHVVFLRQGHVVANGPLHQITAQHGGRHLVISDTPEHRTTLDGYADLTYTAENHNLVTSPLPWDQARTVVDTIAGDSSDIAFRSRSLSELFVDLLGGE